MRGSGAHSPVLKFSPTVGTKKLPHICLPWPCLGKRPGLQEGVAAYHIPCLEEGGRGPVEKCRKQTWNPSNRGPAQAAALVFPKPGL